MKIRTSMAMLTCSLIILLITTTEKSDASDIGLVMEKALAYSGCLSDVNSREPITSLESFNDAVISCRNLRSSLNNLAGTEIVALQIESKAKTVLKI